MMEDKPITDLPDRSPNVQGILTGLTVDGIEVTPGRPDSNRPKPGPLRLNPSPNSAPVEGRAEHGPESLDGHNPPLKIPMLEDEPTIELPDLSDLPADVQEFIRGLAREGIEVTPGRPVPNRILPEPLRANTSLSAAVIEEREEYEW